MKTLKNIKNENKTQTRVSKLFQAVMIITMLFIASDIYAQTNEVEFEVYTTNSAQASQYLLGDNVALRDCASSQCDQLTTIKIGTNVKLLAKSETPQIINGVKSRWYKIKMGPQVGWIWGGLISQKTMVSHLNPEVKFVFGEAGVDYKGYKRFQIRAVKNGTEIDKIFVKSENLNHKLVNLLTKKENTYESDVITLCTKEGENCETDENKSYIVFKNNTLMKTSTLAALAQIQPETTEYAFTCQLDEQ